MGQKRMCVNKMCTTCDGRERRAGGTGSWGPQDGTGLGGGGAVHFVVSPRWLRTAGPGQAVPLFVPTTLPSVYACVPGAFSRTVPAAR